MSPETTDGDSKDETPSNGAPSGSPYGPDEASPPRPYLSDNARDTVTACAARLDPGSPP
jgi:hypothetical protein